MKKFWLTKMKKISNYKEVWIFGAILCLALIVSSILIKLDDPWTWSDWASNVIFAFGITITTVLLGRRQSKLQESLAALALSEKIAVISGSTDIIEEHLYSGNVVQLLNDMRAGLYLYQFGDQKTRYEYLAIVCNAVNRLKKFTIEDSRAYMMWTVDQWHSISNTASLLIKSFDEKVTNSTDLRSEHFVQLNTGLEKIRISSGINAQVPFDVFERRFHHGDAGDIIRVVFDWKFLEQQCINNKSEINIIRHNSEEFLQARTVYSPWYTNDDGQFVDFNVSNSYPMSFNEMSNFKNVLPPKYWTRIQEIQNSFYLNSNKKNNMVLIVTLRIASDKVLVLDGNHRIAAVLAERTEYNNPITAKIVEFQVVTKTIQKLIPDCIFHYLDSPYRSCDYE